MRAGYLYLLPCQERPNAVCLHEAAIPPGSTLEAGIVVHFRDLDAAAMHFHAQLRRRLLDLDARAYGADMVEAAAILDAIELRHQRIYLAPEVAASPMLARVTDRYRRKHRRVRRVFDAVGILALLLLVVLAALPL